MLFAGMNEPVNWNDCVLIIQSSNLECVSESYIPLNWQRLRNWFQVCIQQFFLKIYSAKRASQVALVVKNPPASAGDIGDNSLIPGLGRSPGGGHDNPLKYFGLENSMDCIVHGVIKSWTWLSNFHKHTHIHIECTLVYLTYYFQYNNLGIECFNINCLFLKFMIRIVFYKHIMMFKNLLFDRHFGFSEVLSY